MLQGSWKTGITGWLILLGSLAGAGVALLDGNPATNIDFNSIVGALAGVGLIVARDNDKSTEQVKAAGEVTKK